MKRNIRKGIMVAILMQLSVIAFAQDNTTPKWISKNGYWIIENNIHTPKSNVVKFYNNENTMIYSEKLEGVRLNVKKQKTLVRLKKALDQSLLAWQKMQDPKEGQLVKNIFK